MHDDARRDLTLAHYYNLEYANYSADIEFYVQLARWLDPDQSAALLEIGCGTGRVAIALAEAGFRITALDLSPGMLDLCMKQAQKRNVADKVLPVCADVRKLEGMAPERYGLALCALNTFAYLTNTEDQLRALNAVRRLLIADGLLVLDLTPPLPDLLLPANGETIHQGSFPDPHTGDILHKFVAGTVEYSTQLHRVTILYDLEAADGTLRRTSQQISLRWTCRYEMELLLQAAGYTVENVYGDYDLEEYGEGSERMIFVARRSV